MLSESEKRWIFPIAILIIIIEQTALDIYLPSMPAMSLSLATSTAYVQYTIAFFMIGLMCARLVFGPLADAYGRRLIVLISSSIFILGALGCTLSTHIYELWAFRVLQGIGAGGISTLSLTILSDVHKGKYFARLASYLAVAWASVPVVAPLLGGYFEQYFGWHFNFLFIVVFSIILHGIIHFKLKETIPAMQTLSFSKVMAGYKTLLTHKQFMIYSGMLIALSAIFTGFSTLAPFIIQNHLGYSAVAFGWFSMIPAGSYMLGSYLNGRLVLYVPGLKLSFWGSLSSLSIALFFVVGVWHGAISIYWLLIPISLIFFGVGFVYANGMNGCMEPFPNLAGSTSALMGSFIFLGCIMANVVASFLSFSNLIGLALMFLAFLVINFLGLLLILPKKLKKA